MISQNIFKASENKTIISKIVAASNNWPKEDKLLEKIFNKYKEKLQITE